MKKKHIHRSVMISLVLSVLFFLCLFVAACLMPGIVSALIHLHDHLPGREAIGDNGVVGLFLLAYGVLFTAVAANIMLFWLLLRVKNALVFTEKSVSLVRGISWCAMGVGGYFLVLGFYFLIALAIGFCALFMGLCLRVVKNVIEEATAIKQENDLTI